MELTQGYKQTELGVIPEDWRLASFSELVTEFRGGAPLKPSDFTPTGIKVLPKGGVGRTGWLRIHEDDLQYCSPSYAAAHRTNQVDQSYTIVVLRDLVPSGPSIGLMVQIQEAEIFVLAQGVYGFKVNQQADPCYLVQLSNTRWYRQLMNSIMVGSTQVHITNTAFKRAQIPLPNPPEQRAIAEALSDVDALLGGLDRLIAKKRDLKQGVMQQLLTGQTRLPGFHGEWKVKRLKTIVQTPVTDGPHLTPQFLDNGIPFLSVNNLVGNRIDLTDLRFISRQDHEVFSRKCKPQKDDILLGKAASVGKVAIVELDCEFNIWSPIALIRVSREHAARFVYYQLQSADLIGQIALLTNSSSQGNIGMGDIEKLTLKLPPLAEQTAIAEVLSEMDGELGKLEERREKTRALKQAMMQELLTGRTRLV